MTEETYGEVWEREQRDGMPVGKRLKRIWHDHKWLFGGWVFVLSTIKFVADSALYPPWFLNGFLLLLCGVSVARIIAVHQQHAEFDGMMNIVRSLPREAKE